MKFYREKFKKIRLERALPVTFIADQVGVSRRTVWLWESGRGVPKSKYIRAISDLLKVKTEEISDLPSSIKQEKNKFDDLIGSWIDMASYEDIERITNYKNFMKELSRLFKNLEQTNIILKAVLSISGPKFYIKDAENNFILANNEFKDLVDVDMNLNIFGSNDYRFFPKSEAKVNEQEDLEVIEGGNSIIREGFIPGTRKKKWGIITKQPLIGKNNRCFGMVGTFIDITERKNAEELRELMEINLNSMDNGIIIIDRTSGKYLYVNPATAKMYGYSLKSIYSKDSYFWVENIVHPDHRIRERNYLDNYSWPKDREYKLITKNGSVKWINSYISDVKTYKGNEYCIIVEKDITGYKKWTEEIEMFNVLLDSTDLAIWFGKSVNDDLLEFDIKYSNKVFDELYFIDNGKNKIKLNEIFKKYTLTSEKILSDSPYQIMRQYIMNKDKDCYMGEIKLKILHFKDDLFIGVIEKIDQNSVKEI